jgi:hypothetical protein
MRASPFARSLGAFALIGTVAFIALPARAYTFWSTPTSFLGTGEFHGPGANPENERLFAMVIRNMMFQTAVDFVTPFSNNGSREPNICADASATAPPDGKLSDGSLINENVNTCPAIIAGVKIVPAAVAGGRYQGEHVSVTLQNGDVVMAMDFAIDLGADGRSVTRFPFHGTTGEVTIPESLQTQMGGKGVDQAGKYPSGTRLRGRIGDFNHDGWIDGTILATGVLPLDSSFHPGQPYLIIRTFETDIPLQGQLTGNVKALSE